MTTAEKLRDVARETREILISNWGIRAELAQRIEDLEDGEGAQEEVARSWAN